MHRNKDGTPFYKYYSAETALRVLTDCTRKWSNPIEFNDPFDNQFDFYFEELDEDTIAHQIKVFEEILNSDYSFPVTDPELKQQIQIIRAFNRSKGNLQSYNSFNEQYLQNAREAVIAGVKNASKLLPGMRENMKEILKDISIFCVSETYENILMWSHYADCHQGVVIAFLALEKIDSPLLVAKPVKYAKEFPKLRYQDYFNSTTLAEKNGQGKVINEFLTLTKSDLWTYEKEWRIV